MMGKIHKILVGLSMLLFLFTAYGMIALVTTESVHGQTVTQVVYSGNGTITVNGDYQLSSDFTGTITIGNAVTDVKIIGNGSEHQHTNTNISVAGDRTVALNLTIEDLNIAAATGAWPDPGDHGIDFGDAGNFQHNLYISGRSTIGGGSSKAGIHVPNDIALTINLAAGETQGEILVSSQGAGAGIGGGSEGAGGTITIAGGTVTAKGGFGGAGIGGGFEGAGGTITITGGTVTATSYYGAGIGSGSHGAGGTITITGGEVTATGNEGGAGIGGGHNGLHGIITITGGTVTATGGRSDYRGGAGIGGGGIYNNSGSGGTITITGGTVIAKSGEIWGGSTSADRFGGAGIGGGGNGSGGVITIEGGEVEATGGDEYVRGHGGAGIGGGSNESGGIITIAGGTVSATGGSGGAGIGSGGIHIGNSGSGGTITITGGNVIAKGGGYGAANIGGGKNGEGGIVYIKGENTNVVATGNDGWDIGSGSNNDNGGSLSVGEGATVDITSTNAEIDKKLILRNFTVSPETDATTLDTVVLAVNVDGIIFSIFQEIHQGVISFKANGEEIERAEIIAEGSSTRGTASINVCNLPDGTYTFLAEYVEGEGNGFHAENPLQITNYSISKTNQDSLIMHIPPTITYGDDSFDIEVRGGSGTGAISYQVTSGNAITVDETGRVTIVASGDAEVNVTKAGDQHYHEAEAIVSITVTPKPLTITADDKSKLQGETDPEFTVTYTGFIEGEDTSNLEGELVLNREEGEEAGTYIITPSGLTSTNYSITFETGILRIINTNPDLSSLTLSSGGLNPTFSPGETSYTASVTNSVSSITVTPETEDNHAIIKVNNQTVTSGQASEAIALKVGANTITVEVTAEDGVTIKTYTITIYVVSKTNQDSLIMHIPPTITYGDDSFDIEVGGGSGTGAISYQVTSGNAITVGETGRVTIVASGDAEVNVTKAGDQHYHEAEAIVSITVTPKPLTITADDKSKLQGETDPEFTVTYTGFIEGEDTSNLEGELVLNREEGEEAGTYIITPSGLTSTNYSITFETGILRIINTSPDLSSLTLSSGGLNPTFSPGETSYTASVTNSVSSITVTPEAEDNHATIKVNNQTVTSGQASEAIALKVGANTITVEVTAEDGVTIKTYTITINRAAPSSGGGGGYTPPISPPQPAPIPDVTGGVSTDTVTLGTEVLEKQATITDSGGMVEIFTLQTIAAQQQLVAARLEGKTTMEIKIESNPMTTTIINIPEDFLKSSVDMKVTVATQQATLELPATLVAILAEAGEGLSLRMERGDAEIVQKGLDETRYGEGSAILGNPTMVNTTLKGETTVILPLEGIAFPEDAQQREDFLDSLAVFVIHSDGEKKVIGGEIIFDADGNPVSIKFSVDRFSTFAIIKQSEALKQRNIISLTIGDRTAIINGRSYKLDAAPLIDPKTNRTLVPLRFVSEMLGAKVEWLKESRQVRITQQETEIILTIGSHTAVVNNNIIALDCPAEILPPGRTFVPLRFVSQALGANIEWDESTQTITISQ